jgi:hypothetical protein
MAYVPNVNNVTNFSKFKQFYEHKADYDDRRPD